MSEQQFRVNDLVKFNYSEIGKYIDENHTDRPLRNDEVVELLNEQQATIQQLQDLCGKSDYENAMLRKKNKELQDKIDWLCEVFDYGSDESMKVVRQKKEK